MRLIGIPPTLAAGGGTDRDARRDPHRGRRAGVAWLRARSCSRASWSLDQLTKHAVEHSIVPGEERKFLPGVAARQHAQPRRRVRLPARAATSAVTILIALALLALLVYFALHATRPLIWLPTGMLDRRRARQHPRPPAPRLGHRLHQAAARLAPVQPRRHLDHARHPDPVRADRPLAPRRLMIGSPPARARSRSPTRTSTCSSSTRAPAWSCTPRAGTARTRSRSCWRRCSRPAARPGAGAGIVHRLDRDTSGLLVVARTDEAHRLLQAALARQADRARVPRAGRGTPAGALGHDRGADRPRPARAHAHGRRRRQRARGPHPLHARARARRAPRCCACAWRRGAPTRSASTCRRSAIRCAGIPSTAPRACSGSSASSCTRRAWRSSIRSRARASRSSRRCPPTSRARWRAPNGLS